MVWRIRDSRRTRRPLRLSPARLVQSLAGRTAGAVPTRRGTILIIVIGALALLSVITVAYVSLGKSDKRSAAVFHREANVNETIDRIVEYITRDVIAADRFSIYKSAPADLNDAGYYREAMDYPFTPWLAISDDLAGPAVPPTAFRFSPVGTFPADFDPTQSAVLDDHPSFPPSDPWLAATVPTWLNYNIDAPTDKLRPYLDMKDWAKISNIAPDGRFINLINLRGNFDAEAGGGIDLDTGLPRLSQGLTLFKDNEQPYNANLGAYPSTSSTRYDGEPARLNFPAHWDSGQRFAFRPARDAVNGPDSPIYLHYQYADADGDGFFDSRWQALIDASDPDNPISILPLNDDYRWFVASRIIDLSSLVNVNTATGIVADSARPDEDFPIGVTPADIDLTAILADLSNYQQFGDAYNQEYDIPVKYEQSVVLNYTGALDQITAAKGARWAFNALYNTIKNNQVPPPPPNDLDKDPATFIKPQQRAAYYQKNGAFFQDVGLSKPPIGQFSYGIGGLFGIEDEIELLTRYGLNDDSQHSRLERAVGGRIPDDPPNDFEWYSPLRDNWPTPLEYGFIDVESAFGSIDGDGKADPNALLKWTWDRRHLLTTISGSTPFKGGPIIGDPTAPEDYADYVTLAMLELNTGHRDEPVDAYGALLAASGDNGAAPEPYDLFAAYVRSLIPHIDEITADPNIWKDPSSTGYWTTVYGRSPELAILTAAHLAANAVDCFDKDIQGQYVSNRGPSAFTLRLSDQFQNQQIGFQWPLLDMGNDLLPDSNDDLPTFKSGAVNVFGIEAQPFVTEVASMLMYTDEHYKNGMGGDDEYVPPGNGFPPDIDNIPEPVTIKGEVEVSNGDFVMQVLAVQLTNPFDEDVHLTSLDVADGQSVGADVFLYYIEYCGKTYKLAEVETNVANGPGNPGIPVDPDASGLTSVVLEPGETRTFYALSQPFNTVYLRWKQHDDTLTEEQFRTWFDTQIGVRLPNVADTDPVLIEPFDDASGAGDQPMGIVHEFFPATNPEDQKEVRLWRRMTKVGEGTNIPNNDLLADRLYHIDMLTTLDRSFVGNKKIGGTVAGPDPTQDPGGNHIDNTGLTIILWGSVRRPDDPSNLDPDIDHAPLGAIPAWCIERRASKGMSLNQRDINSVSMVADDFEEPIDPEVVQYGFEDFNEMIVKTSSGGLGQNNFLKDALVETLVQRPEDKTGADIDSLADSLTNLTYERLYPQIHLNNEEWTVDPDNNPNSGDEVVRLRLADMLLPLAIGPTYDPTGATNRGDGWITLSESLCSALGYDSGLGGGIGDQPSPFDNLWLNTDRGNLMLDFHTCYFDDDGGGDYFPNTGDVIRGDGIPTALNILNAFTTVDPRFGSLTKPRFGTININTAPVEVLRTLPMLSPPQGSDPVLGQAYWWWDPANADVHNWQSDIASNIVAYRDKRAVWPRDIVNPNAMNALNFDELTQDIDGDVPDIGLDEDPTDASSREARTGINGLRENPGFGSIGELMVVRDLAFNPGLGGGVGGPYLARHDIDRLGVDESNGVTHFFNVEEPGVLSSLYEKDMDGEKDDADEIDNDYASKLAIANGLLNVVDVRSDIYAVWFVVHGYQRADVEGLRPEEPMVPSVARRYLMIVDRSNVTKLGDKPKILAIKQLPL